MTTLRLPPECIEQIREVLLTEAEVRVEDLGIFRLRLQAARQGRNPRTGDKVRIPPRLAVSFRPAKALRDRLDAETGRTFGPDADGSPGK